MSASFYDYTSIPGSPDLSRPSPPGHSRTSSARPSGSRSSQCSPSHNELIPRTDALNTPCPENEALITSSHGCRTARPSTLSPGPSSPAITLLHSAISDQYLPYTPDQDVLRLPELLNHRPISHPGLSPNPGHQLSVPTVLESSQLSSLSTRHVALNSHSARPRTSNQVFNNISDLAAHYGIPQFLPVAPRTTPRRTTDFEDASSSQLTESYSSPDFANLCSNYLTMLSQKPGDAGAHDVPLADAAPVAAATDVTDAEAIRSLMDVLAGSSSLVMHSIKSNSVCFATATPELQMSNDLNEYLTSPLIDSPFDDDLLTTPAVGSDMHADIMTSPLMGDFGSDSFGEFPSLFGGFDDTAYQVTKPEEEPLVFPQLPNIDKMYSLETPNTPFIDSPIASPSNRTVAPLPSTKRKSATGTRKNITPGTLVPVDAPTQSRKYVIPSTTSRKELPATFRRKRLRTAGAGDEEDQLAEEGLTPSLSELEQIEVKRRQNTVAARRSRKRKLEYQRELEQSLEEYKRESEVWKQRALTCQALLRSHHIDCSEFSDS
ncbi:hypothetical protein JVT61DRAFT_884 [Boletus reticuloceps]|uniref:BZIP domain-containing protein n=1 Tax=Boletus reticuloceps TaxID=495285 RepID=A0A8I2YTS3_9AGAM|nr:hypothetical protein JVT61DRAFT_884 [Boletus reticuloceps]